MKLTKREVIGLERGLAIIGNMTDIKVRTSQQLATMLRVVGDVCADIRHPITNLQKQNKGSFGKQPEDMTEADKAVIAKIRQVEEDINDTLDDEVEIELTTINIDDLPETGISPKTLQFLEPIIE